MYIHTYIISLSLYIYIDSYISITLYYNMIK